MADFLLAHEQMRWSIVTGRYDGRLVVSLRTRNPGAEAGRLLWRLLGSDTSAGGHAMIAGGSIPVGRQASEAAWRATERNLARAFLRSQGYEEPFAMEYPYQRVHQERG
jgi:nanoRNase/pAp phosphatase (c-di-AMP/oligoRNAs hydrolase)